MTKLCHFACIELLLGKLFFKVFQLYRVLCTFSGGSLVVAGIQPKAHVAIKLTESPFPRPKEDYTFVIFWKLYHLNYDK